MQTKTLRSSEVAPNARVIRIWRSPARNRRQRARVGPSATGTKPSRKWTGAAAFALSLGLHGGPVVLVEMQQERPPVEVGAPVLNHSVEEVTFETGAETRTPGAPRGRTGAD